jgi:hypothetical protein
MSHPFKVVAVSHLSFRRCFFFFFFFFLKKKISWSDSIVYLYFHINFCYLFDGKVDKCLKFRMILNSGLNSIVLKTRVSQNDKKLGGPALIFFFLLALHHFLSLLY